jgi:two-component system phosphate regulon sensor histidine kinase PhoR
MTRKRLLLQLYPSYLAIILISLFIVSWYALRRTEALHHLQLERDLLSQARLLERTLHTGDGSMLSPERIAQLCREFGRLLPIRVTVLLENGRVIGDSDENPALMENHRNRPEVRAAAEGKPTSVLRYSSTVSQRMLYMAVPVSINDRTEMFVRVAMPVTEIDKAMRSIFSRIAIAALFVSALAAMLAFWVARRLTAPLQQMREGAIRFAQGDLSYKLPVTGSEEMAALSTAMNQMAAQMDDRIKQLFSERNTRLAVFDSMTEGLLAINKSRVVVELNRAAGTLLGIDIDQAKGKPLETRVRNAELHRLMTEASRSDTPVEGEIELNGGEKRILTVRSSALRNQNGDRIGALAVMQDITRVRQLEQMRQDFVANVSHELKTPITSIKGFVETLQDGADADPVARARFLGIIAKQAEHLNAIVADLLLLASVEHQTLQHQVKLEPLPLKPILESAVEVCNVQAAAKQIPVRITCPENLMALASTHLLEQAVTNLVDNAIKYSDPGGSVDVIASSEGPNVIIDVKDNGRGIEQRHLERLFERFYRVDKGRSRQLGGTGLGLAIVKHIALAHGGRITVKSALGEGSTFRLHLQNPA